MKEISPTEMKQRNKKGQDKMKKTLRKTIRKAADEGYDNVYFNPKDFAYPEAIEEWLRELGFEVVHLLPTRTEIRW